MTRRWEIMGVNVFLIAVNNERFLFVFAQFPGSKAESRVDDKVKLQKKNNQKPMMITIDWFWKINNRNQASASCLWGKYQLASESLSQQDHRCCSASLSIFWVETERFAQPCVKHVDALIDAGKRILVVGMAEGSMSGWTPAAWQSCEDRENNY